MVKIARVVPEISLRRDRQTRTDMLITILRHRSRGRSNPHNVAWSVVAQQVLHFNADADAGLVTSSLWAYLNGKHAVGSVIIPAAH